MKFACPKCRTPHAVADSELPAGRTFRFVCSNCGHTIGVRRKEDAAVPAPGTEASAAQLTMTSPQGAEPLGAPHAPAPAAEPMMNPAADPMAPTPTVRARPSAPAQHAAPPASAVRPQTAPPAAAPPHAAPPTPAQHGARPAAAPAAAQPSPQHTVAPHAAGAPPSAQHAPPAAAGSPPPAARPASLAAPQQGAPQPASAAAQVNASPPNKVQMAADHASTAAVAEPAKPAAQLNPFSDTDPGTRPAGKALPKAAASDSGADDDDDFSDLDAPGTLGDSDPDLGDLGDDDLADLENMPAEQSFLSADEQAYVEAAPGQATQLFMQTAGIYKRRKRLRVAAWSIGGSLIAICALATADVTGLMSVPVMGAVYDAAGLQDPDAHRGIERAKSQLSSATLTQTQRDELRHKLLGYDAEVPAPPPPKSRRIADRKALEPPATAAQVFSKIDRAEDAAAAEPAGTQAPANAAAEAAPARGELSAETITRVVKANSHGLAACMNDMVRKAGNVSGKLEIQVVILPSGDVKEAQVETEHFKNTPLGHCAVKRVKGWHFPRFNAEPMTVVFPYVLSGGG